MRPAVLGTFNAVVGGFDIFRRQSLVQSFGLAWRDRGIVCAMHNQERRCGAADKVNRVSRCCFIGIAGNRAPFIKYCGAVDPDSFCRGR